MTPRFFRVRQRWETTCIENVAAEVRKQLDSLFRSHPPAPGKTVAITAGSRGIKNIDTITKAVVDFFKELGLKPFLVPAMGSHGGATAQGQSELLARYGITEEAVGCPIRSSMETAVLGNLGADLPIHCDRYAAEADHVFLVNRIKPHTRFAGPIESGLSKMLMIGLGKEIGASLYHRVLSVDSFDETIRRVVSLIRGKTNLLGGLGIVENVLDQTAILRATPPDEIENTDGELLVLAREMMPRLPFEEIDLLFIDRIGKNISGTGMDSNVVGRKFDDHKAVPGDRQIVHCIAVRGLTPETGGNANGIGMAEFCLGSVLKAMDVHETRINAIAANHVSAAMLPLDYDSEEEILEAARRTLGFENADEMKILRIRDTLHLETLLCSESLWCQANELASRGKLEILEEPLPGRFDVDLVDRTE